MPRGASDVIGLPRFATILTTQKPYITGRIIDVDPGWHQPREMRALLPLRESGQY